MWVLSSKKIQNFRSRKPKRHFVFAIKEKRAVGKILRFEFHIWHALMLVQKYEAPKKKTLNVFFISMSSFFTCIREIDSIMPREGLATDSRDVSMSEHK
jgi:hypothetical protein